MRVPRRWREGKFLALVAACGLAIAGSVAGGLHRVATPPAGGWRKVDPRLLEDKLRDGTLVRHEASFYRAAP